MNAIKRVARRQKKVNIAFMLSLIPAKHAQKVKATANIIDQRAKYLTREEYF